MTRSNFHLVLGIAIGCTSLVATFAIVYRFLSRRVVDVRGRWHVDLDGHRERLGRRGRRHDRGRAPCNNTCSNDLKNVVDCFGTTLTQCTVDQGCADAKCIDDPCKAAEQSKSSYGCDYWALKTALRPQADGACFAAFVANTWGKPVHLKVDRGGVDLPRRRSRTFRQARARRPRTRPTTRPRASTWAKWPSCSWPARRWADRWWIAPSPRR